jgi:hypothetical protein
MAGGGTRAPFPGLAPGDGVGLLCNSYGLLVGLWQLMHTNQRFGAAMQRPRDAHVQRDYEAEVERAVLALWTGVIEAARPLPNRSEEEVTMKTASFSFRFAACSPPVAWQGRPGARAPVLTQTVVPGATSTGRLLRARSAPVPRPISASASAARSSRARSTRARA